MVIKVKNNGVLIESSDPQLENIIHNEKLIEAGLFAKLPEKQWPKLIFYIIPNNLTEDEFIDHVSDNIKNELPVENWFKQTFKIGDRNKDTVNWIIESHPLKRKYCYRPPREVPQIFFENLNSWLNELDGYKIVAGDFNCRSTLWFDRINDATVPIIEELVLNNNLTIINSQNVPTFENEFGTSHIDLTMISYDLNEFITDWEIKSDII
ncbi:hypothetical protein ILUMI_14223, partial [Ignelater luminosus]